MSNTQTNNKILLERQQLQLVEKYIYLGKRMTTKKDNMSELIFQRIKLIHLVNYNI